MFQMNTALQYADAFYHKLFLIEKENHVKALFSVTHEFNTVTFNDLRSNLDELIEVKIKRKNAYLRLFATFGG